MKKSFPALLRSFLWALLPGVIALSLLLRRSGSGVSWLLSLPLLCLWCALLVGADRLLRIWGPLLLCVPAALALLLFADRGALAAAIPALLRRAPIALPASAGALWLFLSALSCAVSLMLLREFPLRCAFSLLSALAWVAAAFFSLEPPRLALCALLPLLLDTLAEVLARRRGAERAPENLLPLFTLVGALLLLLPTSREPYPYPLLSAMLDRVVTAYHQMETELLYRREGEAEYSLDFNGNAESETEADKAEKDADAVLYLSAAPRTAGVFYLSGSTWNSFDGQEWHSTVDRGMIDFLGWSMDTAERLYALWRWNRGPGTPCYPEEDQLLFRYDKLNIRTIFTAPDTFFIRTATSRFPFTTRPSRVLFNYVQERDAWYRLFVLRFGTLDLETLAEYSQGYEYDSGERLQWSAVLKDFNDAYGLDLERSERVESQLAQRESFIRSSYLALPENTSDRVLALAQSITAGCETDLERLTAIEDYLHAGYDYTLAPAPAPEGVPFLDHLLFDAKEGFCTWYATAAAILARAVGVPTRYVLGYRAELRPGETVDLSAQSGHAWCEAYIRGYGWVVVEATPGFTASPSEAIFSDSTELGEGGTLIPGGAAEQAQPEEESADAEAPENSGARAAFWLPVLAAALLAAALAAVLFRRRREARRYATAPYSERAKLDLQRLSRYLAWRGYPKGRTESLREWFGRVRWHYLLLDADEAMGFALLYEAVLFGEKAITEADWLAEKEFVDGLKPRRRFFR